MKTTAAKKATASLSDIDGSSRGDSAVAIKKEGEDALIANGEEESSDDAGEFSPKVTLMPVATKASKKAALAASASTASSSPKRQRPSFATPKDTKKDESAAGKKTKKNVSIVGTTDTKTYVSGDPVVARKSRKFRPGTRALMNIRKHQKNGDNLAAVATFRRCVRMILKIVCIEKFNKGKEDGPYRGYRITEEALLALQDRAEPYITSMLRVSGRFARHAKRIKLKPEDLDLARTLYEDTPELEQQSFI